MVRQGFIYLPGMLLCTLFFQEIEEHPKYIFFDFETWEHPEKGLIPNAVVAQYCDGSEFQFPKDDQPMTSEDIMNEFGLWLFHDKHKGFTIMAHNFRSFDGQFIVRHMTQNGMKISVIKRGTQILEIDYPRLQMKSRDTLNFCALKLSDFPKSVGLGDIAAKGTFPHHINKPENWDKVIPFPEPKDYGIDGK